MLPFALLVTPELRGHPLFPGFPYLWAQHRAHSVQFEENMAMWVYDTPGSSQLCPDSGSCPVTATLVALPERRSGIFLATVDRQGPTGPGGSRHELEPRKLSEHGGRGWQSGGHHLGTQKAEGSYKEKNNVGVGVLRCSIFSFLGVFILRLALPSMWVSWPPAHRSTCLLDCWD